MPDSRGWLGPQDGCTCSRRARKHHDTACPCWSAPVSDPAPIVEGTTTEGGDVTTEDNHSQADPDKGPWFGAMYEGRCSVSECRIEEGDRIRADGLGGYECEDCGDDPNPPHDWQAQARAAARRHMAAQGELSAPVANANDPVEAADKDYAAQVFMSPTPVDRFPRLPDAVPLPTPEQFMDPAATRDVEPVMGVNGQPKKVRRDHMKRYAVVLPGETELERYKTSGNPVGRTRATTFNKAATDKKNINDWGKRNVVIGASRRRDLLLKAQGLTHEADRDRLNAIVVELEDAAGAKVGSDLGTYLHEFTEYIDAGLKTWEDAPEEFRESLYKYTNVLNNAGLEPITSLIERTTIIREFGWVCGTFDRIFYHRPSGQYVIGDLKTGKTMDYGKNEVECQLWTYAHGVNQNGIYDWNTDMWEEPHTLVDVNVRLEVSESVGVVIHMPVQGPKEGTVELLWADLESGRQHAELCHAVRSQPSGRMKPWGDGPAPLAPGWAPVIDFSGDWEVRASVTPVPVADPTPVLGWDYRFRTIETVEEASELWRGAKADGVDRMELQRLVSLAQQRLRELGVRG
jgi:hypothetical protein